MIKIKFLFCLLGYVMFNNVGVNAQNIIMVHGATPKLHLIHKIAPKESWSAIGKLYNIAPKEIADFNALSMDAPLSIGQQIQIPLTSANFSQDGQKASDEVFVPLYHTVQEKEWMYRISVNHNKVPIETLEKWNNISRDNAKAGTKLIVGYLKVKSGQSALAAGNKNTTVAVTQPKEEAKKTTEPPVAKKTDPPVVKKEEPVVKKDETAVKTEETKKPVDKVETNTTPTVTTNYKGGYFKTMYGETGKAASGNAGVFKSTSGWNDGKYYALMNDVPVGTIVKVSFPSTKKSIYAKVLGQLPEMKESAGLTIRISDAAVAELGAGNTRFSVAVNY